MARPEKNTVEYFPFLCEEGKKMYYLEETYGNDGFAVFVKLLRELAKTNYHYLDLSKKTTLMFLSAKCKVSLETLESIINDLVELEKFNPQLWHENKIIWCQDFIDSIQDAYNKRKNKCITFDGLLLHLISLGIRKPSKLPSQGVGNTQTILKETKVKKTIEDRKSDFKKSLHKYLDEFGSDLLNEFCDYWTEHGERDKKMRFEKQKSFNIKLRLNKWLKNQKEWKKEKSFAKKEKKQDAYSIIQQVKNGTYEQSNN